MTDDERKLYVELLAQGQSESEAAHVMSMLDSTVWDLKLEAIRSVADMNLQQAIEPLFAILEGGNSTFQTAAAASLQRMVGPEYVDEIVDHLVTASSAVKIQLLKALGRIGGERALGATIEHLGDADYRVREAAAQELGKTVDRSAADALVGALGDRSADVKRAALAALIGTGDPRSPAILREVLEGDDRSVYTTAAIGMERLGTPGDEQLLIDVFPKVVNYSATYFDRRLADRLLRVLGGIGGVPTVDFVLKLMDENIRFWSPGTDAIATLIRNDRELSRNFLSRIGGDDARESHLAFNALCEMNTATIRDALYDGLATLHDLARANIAYSMGAIARSQFGPARRDADPQATVMHDLLVVALQDSDDTVRRLHSIRLVR